MTETTAEVSHAELELSTDKVERKVPWWAWLAVALCVVFFVSFFVMFASSVTTGEM